MTQISNFLTDTHNPNHMREEILLINQHLTAIPIDNIQSQRGKLYLWNNLISSIPDNFTDLKNLTLIDLMSNSLYINPESLTNLKNLTSIRLCDNSLTTLPKIGDYTSVTVLDLSGNPFTSISDRIGHYTNLLTLHLSELGHWNPDLEVCGLPSLKFISSKIGNLIRLRKLNLESNSLEVLPHSIGDLSSLRSLNVRNNKLTSLPREFSKLTALRNLNLYCNRLTSLPPNFFSINFNVVWLAKNPLNYLSLKDFKLISKSHLGGRLKIVLDDNYSNRQSEDLLSKPNCDIIHLPMAFSKSQITPSFPSLREIAGRATIIQLSKGLIKKNY